MFSTHSKPGSTSIVQMNIIPLRFPLKIFFSAISHYRKKLSNDKISTGLGDELLSPYSVVGLNPKRSFKQEKKLMCGPCSETSILLTRVEKLGFIVSG